MKLGRFFTPIVVAALAFALPMTAGATVKKEGAWPAVEKKVDLEVDGPPSEALKQLAKEAGWSLVLQDGAGIDLAGKNVHVSVEDQPADAVLDALFVGREVVAQRNGPLVTVMAAAPAVVPPPVVVPPPIVPPVPTPVPFPTARGEDREIVGRDLVVGADEIVHNATVTGGSAVIKGTVTGDLVVTGGSASVRSGAHVIGDATVLGGKLRVEKGARLDGGAHVTGGSLERDDGVSRRHRTSHTPSATPDANDVEDESPGRITMALRSAGRSLTRASLLFVLGCVLLALLAPRMERLRVEVASRPMRSFALGIVGAIAGTIAAIVGLGLLCITVIGIPVAVAVALGLALSIYGSVASVLMTFGAAVSGHRTSNPYLHLLVGCGAFLLATWLPYVGGVVTFVVIMLALGALVATKGAGFLERRRAAALMA
jgi:hypothetical protein